MRSRYCWPLGTQSYGRVTPCAALQAQSVGLQSLTACQASESYIDVLRERCSIELRRSFVKRFGSPALSLAALLPPPFPTSAFVISAGATRYPLHCVYAVFRCRAGVPICFTSLFSVCGWQALRDAGLV